MIKARQSEKKEASKKGKDKRTPIKSTPKKKSQHDSAKKAIGSGKAKRSANMASRRGLSQGGGGGASHKVYVGNLSYETSWQDLEDFMNEQIRGSVRHADVMKGPDGRSKGYGIVEFASVKDAKEACRKLNDSEFMGRTIYVREDREEGTSTGGNSGGGGSGSGSGSGSSGLSVFVGNLPFETSWQDLKDFMRTVGNVDKANILEGPDGRSKGCGIVTFQHPKDAQRAIRQLNDSMLKGRPIQVREDREEDAGGKGGGKHSTPSGLSVFVGNLPYDLRWQDLKDHMRRAGNVDKANVMETPDGRSKGCAIVVYQHPKDAQRAIRELTGSTLGGREIFVKEDQRP
eukprot:CAMPEP_0204615596 /NCGR_PEP_ID=MMETSP0717-20131115/3048_1 /ASSEMBLY_ACC=CAM_ASM_000666 /TAXON_ID=230516 /ORGANISM="Chaetoceros curvisetus" /LENGTH=343 /DNA_ID=CAMNT_0051628579 /DNA_START=491 /DNA_END=1522 /DNA_ORIENTATION=+